MRFIILKARKLGCSTLIQAEFFHWLVTSKHRTAVTITDSDEHTAGLHQILERFNKNLPEGLAPEIRSWDKKTGVVFDTPRQSREPGLDSKMLLMTAGEYEVGRAIPDIRYVHCSEVAYWADAGRTMLGLKQAVPYANDSAIILETTANGFDEYFEPEWRRAVAGKSDYEPFFFPWWKHPLYRISGTSVDGSLADFFDELSPEQVKQVAELRDACNLDEEQLAWMRHTIRNNCDGALERFHQEYPSTPDLSFMVTETPYFNQSLLIKLNAGTRARNDELGLPLVGDLSRDEELAVTFMDEGEGFLSVWAEPVPGQQYMISVDTVSGQPKRDPGKNPERHIAKVCAILPGGLEEVAQGDYGRIDIRELKDHVGMLAQWYNGALLAIEVNGPGLGLIKLLESFFWYEDERPRYPWIYSRSGSSLDQRTAGDPTRYGFQTSPARRKRALEALRAMLNVGEYIVRDTGTVREMMTFVRTQKGKWEHKRGSTDDKVIAAAIQADVYLELYNAGDRPKKKTKEAPDPESPEYAEEFARRMLNMRPYFTPERAEKVAVERIKTRAKIRRIMSTKSRRVAARMLRKMGRRR